jgi:hypothetical protein
MGGEVMANYTDHDNWVRNQFWLSGWQTPAPTKEQTKMAFDTQKVIVALLDRMGLTVDHTGEIIETSPGRHPWGGDALNASNFSSIRRDVDDLQEIVMGVTDHLKLTVTVEDGRKVTVKEVPGNAPKGDPSVGSADSSFGD